MKYSTPVLCLVGCLLVFAAGQTQPVKEKTTPSQYIAKNQGYPQATCWTLMLLGQMHGSSAPDKIDSAAVAFDLAYAELADKSLVEPPKKWFDDWRQKRGPVLDHGGPFTSHIPGNGFTHHQGWDAEKYAALDLLISRGLTFNDIIQLDKAKKLQPSGAAVTLHVAQMMAERDKFDIQIREKAIEDIRMQLQQMNELNQAE